MADDEGLGSTDVAVLRLDREKLSEIQEGGIEGKYYKERRESSQNIDGK